MDAIVKMLEKHQPFFEKISRNIYLQAIKDGFLGCMPIVLTSSIFLLIATLPGVVGITLPSRSSTGATSCTTSPWASWASWLPAPPPRTSRLL